METKNIIYIVLVILLVLYISFFIYVLTVYVIPNAKKKQDDSQSQMQNIMNMAMINMINNMQNNNQNKIPVIEETSSCDTGSPQTDFFKESVKKAETVLMGNLFLDGYKYGNAVDLSELDDNTKKSIIVEIII